MRDLYLHIGIDKTGTTFLQESFSAAREVLKLHDLMYPFDGDDARQVDRSQMVPTGNGNTLLSTPASLVEALDRAEAANVSGAERFFYSSEVLYEYLAGKPDPLLALQPAFVKGVGKIHILVFLRDPVVHATSRWQQSVKGWQGETGSLENFVSDRYDHPEKLSALLTRLASAPDIALTVKNYDVHRHDLISVVEEWLSLPQGTLPRDAVRTGEQPVNRSLTWSEAELQRRLNRELGRASGKIFAFRLANETTGLKSDLAAPAVEAQHRLWDRIAPHMDTINALLPGDEALTRRFLDAESRELLTFTPQQADIIAQGIARHIRDMQAAYSLKARLKRKFARLFGKR